jgi:hypothetical protein
VLDEFDIDADLLLTVMLTTITLMKTKLQIGVRLKLQECHCQILFRKIHSRSTEHSHDDRNQHSKLPTKHKSSDSLSI